MGVVLERSCSREFPLLFSASSVVTPKSHGERGLELTCTVVGEAGWKLQLSKCGHARADLCLLGKGKPGIKERCSKSVALIPWQHAMRIV